MSHLCFFRTGRPACSAAITACKIEAFDAGSHTFQRAGLQMNPISLLIVEGNPSFLRVETFFFQKHCRPETFVVGTAVRGEEALAQAKVLRPDVILFDLAVCGCGGPAMIARLKRALPGTAIVARSLRPEAIDREALLAAGVDDFVSKFASPSELLPVMRRACEMRRNRRTRESRF